MHLQSPRLCPSPPGVGLTEAGGVDCAGDTRPHRKQEMRLSSCARGCRGDLPAGRRQESPRPVSFLADPADSHRERGRGRGPGHSPPDTIRWPCQNSGPGRSAGAPGVDAVSSASQGGWERRVPDRYTRLSGPRTFWLPILRALIQERDEEEEPGLAAPSLGAGGGGRRRERRGPLAQQAQRPCGRSRTTTPSAKLSRHQVRQKGAQR